MNDTKHPAKSKTMIAMAVMALGSVASLLGFELPVGEATDAVNAVMVFALALIGAWGRFTASKRIEV